MHRVLQKTATIIPFATDTMPALEQVGKKALGLLELFAAGLPVPEGFCLTVAAYEHFLASVPEIAAIRQAYAQANSEEKACQLENWLSAAQAYIVSNALPGDLQASIATAYRELGGGLVAVRSSGINEDLGQASFAGQYESILGVAGISQLEAAIKQCWASAWALRVLIYGEKHGVVFQQLGAGMGIVVQRLVAADSAGVLFTVNPVSGREDEMVIESCWGLGEALVSGKVQPDRFVIAAHTGTPLQVDIVASRTLGDRQLVEIAALGRQIALLYGCPQDIEFAIASGQIYLLQARPITKLNFTGISGEWTTADFRDGGVAAGVVSPYMWSLYNFIWQHTMPTYLRTIKLWRTNEEVEWAKVFFARPYWNMGAVKQALQIVPGFKERDFDRDLGIEPTYDGDGLTVPVNLQTIWGALPVLFALGKAYRKQLERNRRIVADFPGIEASYDALDLQNLPFPQLLEQYKRLILEDYFRIESAYFYTIFNTSNAKLDFKQVFAPLEKKCGNDISSLALLGGLQDVPHLKPLIALWQLAEKLRQDPELGAAIVEAEPATVWELLAGTELAACLLDFCRTYRQHSTAELDLTAPRWDEDSTFVIQTLQGFLKTIGSSDPAVASQKQYERYIAERAKAERYFGKLRLGRRSFFQKLERARNYAWWREYMRDHSTRLYYQIRRLTLALAKRMQVAGQLNTKGDIFFLTFHEVIALAAGELAPAAAESIIQERRYYNASYRNFKNPNEVGYRYQLQEIPVTAVTGLCGVACSPGQVEGTLRVISSIAESARLQPGDILVTPFTDPGWTPLFGIIGAVVTETGGFLSHAAVVAREYGIPAVLAVPHACSRLKDGARAIVDGTNGSIILLDS
ncbi:MAG: hypothetical protein HY692_08525 [Cyanobacteria bacterium NC_groundwater_1444_Ag_S-0.65um_54_12]|nr:hypothetical protein [Cyanobacteria bacterium NC_groundwater_1444_Ag_S-0.65um_54_12]